MFDQLFLDLFKGITQERRVFKVGKSSNLPHQSLSLFLGDDGIKITFGTDEDNGSFGTRIPAVKNVLVGFDGCQTKATENDIILVLGYHPSKMFLATNINEFDVIILVGTKGSEGGMVEAIEAMVKIRVEEGRFAHLFITEDETTDHFRN